MFTLGQNGVSRPHSIIPPTGNLSSVSVASLVSRSIRDSSRTPQINYCHSVKGLIRVPIRDSSTTSRRTLGGNDGK